MMQAHKVHPGARYWSETEQLWVHLFQWTGEDSVPWNSVAGTLEFRGNLLRRTQALLPALVQLYRREKTIYLLCSVAIKSHHRGWRRHCVVQDTFLNILGVWGSPFTLSHWVGDWNLNCMADEASSAAEHPGRGAAPSLGGREVLRLPRRRRAAWVPRA